mmetsp:Transcript_19441/g.48441  ORF Transcript_19441/g.48441 Transcript_19441/m.48441 type:complete len:110 (+) Transcript_19441:1296-1625(+)
MGKHSILRHNRTPLQLPYGESSLDFVPWDALDCKELILWDQRADHEQHKHQTLPKEAIGEYQSKTRSKAKNVSKNLADFSVDVTCKQLKIKMKRVGASIFESELLSLFF